MMKLRKFEPKTTRKSERTVTVNKVGWFRFSKSASEELVKDAKYVQVYNDEEHPENWYLTFSPFDGLKIRWDKKGVAGFSSSHLQQEIAQTTQNDPDEAMRLKIGNPIDLEALVLYPLLIQRGERKLNL